MGRLSAFAEEIWLADGPVISFLGFAYPTRMAIIRLANAELFVWSPVALAQPLRREIEALGHVRYLVAPNPLHHLYLGPWKEAFPTARLYGHPKLLAKRADLAWQGALADGPEPAWAGQIDQVLFAGSPVMSEFVFVHQQSRTALFADLIENFAPDWFTGWRGLVARLDGIVQPHGGAPREWRASFVQRKLARAALARVIAHAPDKVVMAHGDVVTHGGQAFIQKAFAWLGT